MHDMQGFARQLKQRLGTIKLAGSANEAKRVERVKRLRAESTGRVEFDSRQYNAANASQSRCRVACTARPLVPDFARLVFRRRPVARAAPFVGRDLVGSAPGGYRLASE